MKVVKGVEPMFWRRHFPPGCLVEITNPSDHVRSMGNGLQGKPGDIVAKCNNSISRYVVLEPGAVGMVMRFDTFDDSNVLCLVGQEELWVRIVQCIRISDIAGDNVQRASI
jgi:hypothetical protein